MNFWHKPDSYDRYKQQQSELEAAKKYGMDKALEIRRFKAKNAAAIELLTNGPLEHYHQKGLANELKQYPGAPGFEAYLNEAIRYGYVGRTYYLQHPFEEHNRDRRNEWLDVTGHIGTSNESVGSFATRVKSDLLPPIRYTGTRLAQTFCARIYMLTEEVGSGGHNLYYQLGQTDTMTPSLFAGGATNVSGGGNGARKILNTIMALVQINTGAEVEIVQVSKKYGAAMRHLIQDRIEAAPRQ